VAPCPRCKRENPATAPACAGCGTPLSFDDEPTPSPLAIALDLDRRRPGREAGADDPRFDMEASNEAEERPEETAAEDDLPAEREEEDDEREDEEEEDEDEEEEEDEEEGGDAGSETGPVDAASGEPDVDGFHPASPARRAAAWAIDGALVSALAIAVPVLLLASSGAIPATDGHRCAFGSPLWLLLPAEGFVAVVAFVYATVAHALAGATLGKRIARICVVDLAGRSPGFACSASRSAWAAASILLAGAGMLPALVSPSGRALHDLLAGTRVVEAR
jgi:uncharacterized RDD family membrane protein YckC